MKTASRWFSPRIEQDISLVRWGHWGQPVLVFPTAGGDAEEIERMHLIGVLGPLIEAGRIKVDAERRTSMIGVWAGGDCAAGGRDLTVVAVEDGKIAAESINRALVS